MRILLKRLIATLLVICMSFAGLSKPAVAQQPSLDCNAGDVPMPQAGDAFSPDRLLLNRHDLGGNWCLESRTGDVLLTANYANTHDYATRREITVGVQLMLNVRAADQGVAIFAADMSSGPNQPAADPVQMGDGLALRLSNDRGDVAYAMRVDRIVVLVQVREPGAPINELDQQARGVAALQEQRVRSVLAITPLPTIPKPPRIEPDAEALARAVARAYQIVELPGLLEFPEATPSGINNAGQIVGASTQERSNLGHAVLWKDGSVSDLGTLGGILSSANGINTGGVIVGSAWTAERQSHAFVWERQTMRDLGPSNHDSAASAINDSGVIVGTQFYDDGRHAVMWDGHQVRRLETFESGFSGAVAVNNAGHVLFTHYGSGPSGRAESYLWESGDLTDLGTFEATGMNARLDIVGYGGTPLLDTRAWIWRGGTLYDIGDLGGEAIALGINDHSQVVGWSSTTSGAQHAFIWDEGVLSDLNDLIPAASGWTLSRATAINDHGQIVGIGDFNGQRAAFLLNLVSSVPAATGASGRSLAAKMEGAFLRVP